MSSQKTEHYQLHAWEPSDPFLRSEFNANFSAIDAALHDGLAAVEAIAESRADVVFGSYTGDETANRVIDLGFRPKAVILVNTNGRSFEPGDPADVSGGVFLDGNPQPNCAIVDQGFRVSTNSRHGGHTNAAAGLTPYWYIAFR